MTKPGKFHGFVCANIVIILGMFARQRKKGYVCSNDTGVLVERDPDPVRGPDILFCEDADTPDEIDRKWDDKPPLLAVEVLSPNDRRAAPSTNASRTSSTLARRSYGFSIPRRGRSPFIVPASNTTFSEQTTS